MNFKLFLFIPTILSPLALAGPIVDSNPALIQKLELRRQDKLNLERAQSGSVTSQATTTTVATTTYARVTTPVVTHATTTLPPNTKRLYDENGDPIGISRQVQVYDPNTGTYKNQTQEMKY